MRSTTSATTLGPPPELAAHPVWDLDFPDPFVPATSGRHRSEPLVDADGTNHVLWSDGVTLRRESAIWSQRLNSDGRLRRWLGPVRIADRPGEKPFDGPVLASTDGAAGPGDAEFFVDRWGRLLWAHHARTDEPGYPGHRSLHVGEPLLPD